MNKTVQTALDNLGLCQPLVGLAIGDQWQPGEGDQLEVHSPIDGAELAQLKMTSSAQVDSAIEAAASAFRTWRSVPAPVRGDFVRQFGEQLRAHQQDLATLVSWEAGKITQESLGEVQEMIDICEFAVGLSRQLYGKTIASERPGHRLAEQWHPLGPIGVISAFNFSRCRLGLERGDCLGMWRPGGVEAF